MRIGKETSPLKDGIISEIGAELCSRGQIFRLLQKNVFIVKCFYSKKCWS